jgi:hypothetical protein
MDMNTYQFPYLSAHQSRTQEPTEWQLELASVIEGIFAKGAHELDDLVVGLNASRLRPPVGAEWTKENLASLMQELGR